MSTIKSLMFELFVVIIVFFIVCVAGLIDIKTDQRPVSKQYTKATTTVLEKEQKDIESVSNKIQVESKELEEIKKQMDLLKNSDKTEQWNNTVINYNSKLAQYKKDIEEYGTKLEQYNKKYNSYKLAGDKNENLLSWLKSILGT
ncbi:hypothetical protein [Clostridium sp. DJ247]|uniref:hypothetical protein n=1 Tax=Clostridium sp. DJ247 TaxID=2726188 RepID=UPI001626BA60|nr:hypothetical protein [Clostridium sp. DJ247]MBC2582864.1 hypothetical protein [Clostridium sp. DJ247]